MADVVYFVRDLLFSSKIREAAAQRGLKAAAASDPAALAKAAPGARLVVIDLRLDRALEALDALVADPAAAAVPSIGFVDHERADAMDAARGHGCKHVVAKGQLARELAALLG